MRYLWETRCHILILDKIGSECLNSSDAIPEQVDREKVLLEVVQRSIGSWTNRRYVSEDVQIQKHLGVHDITGSSDIESRKGQVTTPSSVERAASISISKCKWSLKQQRAIGKDNREQS